MNFWLRHPARVANLFRESAKTGVIEVKALRLREVPLDDPFCCG
jgi:hypothetical protein